MGKLLDEIRLPDDIKRLGSAELARLAAEIRDLLVDTVLANGGHLASNLGVVELTLALYKVFDFPQDKVVWDVGHQAYVHKILSGRKDRFSTLRKEGGLSGFPKREESPFDSFNTGHSSTSISAALGIARARDFFGEKYRVVAITGDGALTGGLCYEAMNDAGRSANDLIVVLNDNDMSISYNVGSISKHLSRIRSLPAYFSLRDDINSSLNKVPLVGKPLALFISKIKNIVKYALIPGMFFEEMGFRYIGPVDGHNIDALAKIFSGVAEMRGPVLVHVLTKKGMGYQRAESDPKKYHGIAPNGTGPAGYSSVFGDELIKLAAGDPSIIALSAAMTDGTGLDGFASEFPERFFDVGIAEQHALTLAAGMSLNGLKPVAAIYSTFLQRAYDQVLHDVCMQNAHVVMAVDRAGVVGEDGETHQGIYDIAFLRHMPNITIAAPAYDEELRQMLRFALYEAAGPVAVRYPRGMHMRANIMEKLGRMQKRAGSRGRGLGRGGGRGSGGEGEGAGAGAGEDVETGAGKSAGTGAGIGVSASVGTGVSAGAGTLIAGRGELLLEGGDITIVSAGAMLDAALDAAEGLIARGVGVELISARFLKPFDTYLIYGSVKKTGKLLVVEDGCAAGGFGSAIAENMPDIPYTARYCGLPDELITQGGREAVLRKYGLDGDGLLKTAIELLTHKT